jgi:Fur family transcriptional regulator, ferric uptake regulator
MIQKRNTWQKTAVIDQLNRTDGFLSAQQLHQRIEKTGKKLGLTTVYRALTELVEQGIADSLLNDGEARYRICQPEHHHHLTCEKCGKAVEFELSGFEEQIEKMAKKHGFSRVSHQVELTGICSRCR